MGAFLYYRAKLSAAHFLNIISGDAIIPDKLSDRISGYQEVNMNIQILKLLAKNADITDSEISTVTGLTEDEVRSEINEMKKEGIIRAVKAVIDWEKLDEFYVSAIVELKVTPKPGLGFEEVARKVSRYREVESCYLLSGVSDLCCIVKCPTFQDVSRFISKELSTIESVTSTKTQFVMRRYKELDTDLEVKDEDERGVVSSC